MCTKQELDEAFKKNNENVNTHLTYIKEALAINKEDCKSLTETIRRHIEKIDNGYVTKTELDDFKKLIKKDTIKNEDRIEKLEKLVNKTIWVAVIAIFSNLITVIWFLINNFVIK